MDEPSFQRFVDAVKNEGFAENQLHVIESATSRNYFRAMQLKRIIDLSPSPPTSSAPSSSALPG